MQQFFATLPFDLYELWLFELVARHGSFTHAASRAGLSQSALTRQIQGMEQRLGTQLLERTTRKVELTPAGEILHGRARPLLNELLELQHELQAAFAPQPRTIRVGVSPSIALAYLPGFFFKAAKQPENLRFEVVHDSTQRLLQQITSRELDLAICGRPKSMRKELAVIHSFEDQFTLIFPSSSPLQPGKSQNPERLIKQLQDERWLLFSPGTSTGHALGKWISGQGVTVLPAMQLDSFDLIISLVELGMGISLVPHRALAPYLHRNRVGKISLKPTFSREIVVVGRKTRQLPRAVEAFLQSVLFGQV